jgi:hypothetical protein
MARPGQTESESVPIWLKLSESDAAQLDQVLARPEFAGWTKAEWCLEIIQTALRYYAKRPVAEPGRARPPARPAATEPEPAPPAPEPQRAAAEPGSAPPKRRRAAPERQRAAPKRGRAAPERGRAAPEPPRSDPGPVAGAPEAATAPAAPAAAVPEATAAVPEPPPQDECLHPADARDYQTGTCAACGAILWD